MPRLLTTGDMVAVTGIRRGLLVEWVTDGIVVPAVPCKGPGGAAGFTEMQAVAVAVALQMRESGNYRTPYIGRVIRSFDNISPEELERAFSLNDTHLALIFNDKPILRGPQYDWPNVEKAYFDTMERIEELKRTPQPNKRGRKTGLFSPPIKIDK